MVMRHCHQSRVMIGYTLEQQVEDTVLVGRVEVAGRFVGKDQARVRQ